MSGKICHFSKEQALLPDFQMLKTTAGALISMAVHPCKRGESLADCEN